MIFERKYFYWFSENTKDEEIVRVKDIFYLSRQVSNEPSSEKILSLTQKGIILRDISKNEGQLPESFDKYNKIKKNDIVLNPMDLLTGWVDISNYEGLISPSYKNLRIIDKSENLNFYLYQFQKYYKQRIFFNYGEGVSYDYRWGINDYILMNFPILRKPIEVQNLIVKNIRNKQDEITKKIENNSKKINLLKNLKDSVIDKELNEI